MGKPMVKATYSLDEQTVRTLERLASRLGISKSETLRRAVAHLAAAGPGPGDSQTSALDELQERLALTPEAAAAWAEEVRLGRLDSSRG